MGTLSGLVYYAVVVEVVQPLERLRAQPTLERPRVCWAGFCQEKWLPLIVCSVVFVKKNGSL